MHVVCVYIDCCPLCLQQPNKQNPHHMFLERWGPQLHERVTPKERWYFVGGGLSKSKHGVNFMEYGLTRSHRIAQPHLWGRGFGRVGFSVHWWPSSWCIVAEVLVSFKQQERQHNLKLWFVSCHAKTSVKIKGAHLWNPTEMTKAGEGVSPP